MYRDKPHKVTFIPINHSDNYNTMRKKRKEKGGKKGGNEKKGDMCMEKLSQHIEQQSNRIGSSHVNPSWTISP